MNNESVKSILIIDDDITARKLLSFQLKRKDFQVYEAENSNNGFEILNTNNIDIILCDIQMEGMDGLSFCKEVRKIHKYELLPFIFLTSLNSDEIKNKVLEVGGDDLILKPFDTNELLSKVQSLIKRSEISKQFADTEKIKDTFVKTTEANKILLVDDDLSLSKVFKYNLDKAGYNCEVVNNPELAIDLAKSFQPDLIISDIMMPEMNGFEFRKKILEERDLHSIPFIFLSAKGGEEDILSGYDLGITDYVIKTAGPKVLVAKVSAILKNINSEKQKVVSELHKAADSLRVRVVPDAFPNLEGYQIQHWYHPFEDVPGGDFIDYYKIDENNLIVILGDVMGKRWGAWYFAVAYAGYIRSAIRMVLQNTKNFTPKEILQQVNKSIYNDSKISEVFATLSILTLNNQNHQVIYSGAGDLPVLYKNNLNNKVESILTDGMLLGFSEDGNFKDYAINMNSNDLIVLYTDGLIESRDTNGEPIGIKGFSDTILKIPNNSEPLKFIQSEMLLKLNSKFEDDISLITIQSL
ncbi:MAG: hypothetical protein STSR0008_02900 [Ignavibacterium sp.]